MSKITAKKLLSQEQAIALAVSYAAFTHASAHAEFGADRDSSIQVWGKILVDDQHAAGIEFYDPATIARDIRMAARREAERKGEAA